MFEALLIFFSKIFENILVGLFSFLTIIGVTTPPQVAPIEHAPEEIAAQETIELEQTESAVRKKEEKETPMVQKLAPVSAVPPQEPSLVMKPPEVFSPTVPLQTQIPLIPQATLNEAARKAIVNVFCTTKTSGIFSPATGSGVIIDERGVILTNAHVAQYLLLKDYHVKDFLTCVIRGGSPAQPLYRAELLYLPPIWIEENAESIKLDSPTGTGENDYALLLITESSRAGQSLPGAFPAMAPDTANAYTSINEPVLLASYPAGFLGNIDITKNLWLASTVAEIMKLYTFRETPPHTLDGFSVGGTIVAQEGSSGGGVFSLRTGKLIGILSTSILEGSTDKRDLRAITLSHINESMKRHAGEDLEMFLKGDLFAKKNSFHNEVAPLLTKILTDLLEKE